MAIFSLLEFSLVKGGMSAEVEIEIVYREIRMNPHHGHTRSYCKLAVRYEELGDTKRKELFSLRARASELKDRLATEVNGYWLASRLNSAPDALERFGAVNAFRQLVVEALNRASGFDSGEAEALVSRAQKARAAGAYDDALMEFNAALLQDPDNIAAYHGLARVHLSGHYGLDYAQRLARRAVRGASWPGRGLLCPAGRNLQRAGRSCCGGTGPLRGRVPARSTLT